MTQTGVRQSFTLEDETEVTVTYSLIESAGNQRPYGIRAEMNANGKLLDAAAVAKILADGTVTPVTLNDII